MTIKITNEENLSIELLKKAARHWSDSLWLFADGNNLYVLRKDSDGKCALQRDLVLGTIEIQHGFGRLGWW